MIEIRETDALLVIDVQNDFCPGGNLAIAEGDAVVPVINRLAPRVPTVVLTQDWHPAGHLSFASSHPGKAPFDTVTVAYGDQVLWPDHCIQQTEGAAFHPDLRLPQAQMVIRKGFRPAIDSYSAFFENDKATHTGLTGYLRERGVERVICTGLAYDVCVRYSAEDAQAAGFETVIIKDACRGVNAHGSLDAAEQSFAERGLAVIDSADIAA